MSNRNGRGANREDHAVQRLLHLCHSGGSRDLPAQNDVQSASPQGGALSDVSLSPRILAEWQARTAAEYTSASITQELILWLMVIGAPPDLIDDGVVIVQDELVHSRLSAEVYRAAGGTTPPAIDRAALGLTRQYDVIELDVLAAAVRVFCLGETVAVPLFSHLREHCTEPVARVALERILRDEVRHREFGWDVLDYLTTTSIASLIAPWLRNELPALFVDLMRSYGILNKTIEADNGQITDSERAWGLAAPRDYATILDRTFERDYLPRFAARDIAALPAWQAAVALATTHAP